MLCLIKSPQFIHILSDNNINSIPFYSQMAIALENKISAYFIGKSALFHKSVNVNIT